MLLIVLVNIRNPLWHRLLFSKSARICAYEHRYFSLVICILVIQEDREEVSVWSMHEGTRGIRQKYLKRRQVYEYPWECLQKFYVLNLFTYDLKGNINLFMSDFEKSNHMNKLCYSIWMCSHLDHFASFNNWQSSVFSQIIILQSWSARIIWFLCFSFYAGWISAPIHWEHFWFVARNLLLNQYNSKASLLGSEVAPASC